MFYKPYGQFGRPLDNISFRLFQYCFVGIGLLKCSDLTLFRFGEAVVKVTYTSLFWKRSSTLNPPLVLPGRCFLGLTAKRYFLSMRGFKLHIFFENLNYLILVLFVLSTCIFNCTNSKDQEVNPLDLRTFLSSS